MRAHPWQFKLYILMHKVSTPRNLAESISPLSDDPNRSRLWSPKSADVSVLETKAKPGDRAFLIAGPRDWNDLPAAIQANKTFPAFKKQLKLYFLRNSEY